MTARVTRRRLLQVAAAAGAGAAAGGLAHVPSARASTTLRPPGALPPGEFEAACIRCFRCAEVCPPQCIRLDTFLSLDADTPRIDPAEKGCTLCMRCGPACPTGALAIIAVADVGAEVKMGVPELDEDRCRAHQGQPCRLCYDVCPFAGAAVRLDDRLAPWFDESACVGCGLCEEACPVPSKAIVIRPPRSPPRRTP